MWSNLAMHFSQNLFRSIKIYFGISWSQGPRYQKGPRRNLQRQSAAGPRLCGAPKRKVWSFETFERIQATRARNSQGANTNGWAPGHGEWRIDSDWRPVSVAIWIIFLEMLATPSWPFGRNTATRGGWRQPFFLGNNQHKWLFNPSEFKPAKQHNLENMNQWTWQLKMINKS